MRVMMLRASGRALRLALGVAACLGCLLPASRAPGQSRKPERWFDIRAWNVEIDVTTDHHSSNEEPPGDCYLSYHREDYEHTEGHITGVLDQFERYYDEDGKGENSARWMSESCRGSGSTLVREISREEVKHETGCQDGSHTLTIQGSGQDPEPLHVELHIDARAGTYSLSVPVVEIAASREYRGPTSHFTDQARGSSSAQASLEDIPLPAGAVMVLSGTRTFEQPPRAGTGDTIRVSWRAAPVGLQEVELVVDPVGYNDWIPTAGKDEETPGSQILLKATLQARDGKPIQNKAVQLVWELVDTSRLLGICGNFPDAGDPALDMKFDQDRNPLLKITKEGQRAETRIGEHASGQAAVSSYDYGGWSRVKVTARLQSGEEIVGHLKGDRAQKEVRLPKRGPDSKIADAWKTKAGVAGQADYDDLDDTPELDGHKGDGLSLFEEYRGFMEDGKHIWGDPKQKELFVVDNIGGRSKDGIALFVGATKLLVHHKLRSDEADYNGAVNADNKRGNVPRLADKWAIRLRSITDKIGYSYAEGRTGGPKTIVISADVGPGPEGWSRTWRNRIITDRYAATLAHEMLHACNVSHHGDADLDIVEWAVEKNELGLDSIVEYILNRHKARIGGGRPIRIFKENGVELGPRTREMEFPRKIYVGNPHGEHSGVEDCLMRYSAAEAYVPAGDASVRYLIDEPELEGIGLCSSKGGTGVNDPGRKPRSRYGDASLGSCKKQPCVNDALGHH